MQGLALILDGGWGIHQLHILVGSRRFMKNHPYLFLLLKGDATKIVGDIERCRKKFG